MSLAPPILCPCPHLMNSRQSWSPVSPLAALLQNPRSRRPSKARTMWWHRPGSSTSSAVKVDIVPVRGSPATLELSRKFREI